jgi:hypothetical protein
MEKRHIGPDVARARFAFVYARVALILICIRSSRPIRLTLRVTALEAPAQQPLGVEVYALGVDTAGEDTAKWEGLRRFWGAYFHVARSQGDSGHTYIGFCIADEA